MTDLAGRKAVIAKLGMDAHWRGAIVIARALRDAGMEVVYLGHVTPEDAAAGALSQVSGSEAVTAGRFKVMITASGRRGQSRARHVIITLTAKSERSVGSRIA